MLKIRHKEMPKKLKLGFYPYTYVRTTVMKTLLFKKDDYHKMLKMDFGEIAKFLQDSNYRKEISLLAVKHSGADLLELSLNKNLAGTFEKLIRISSHELAIVVNEYIKKYDIEDIKTIIRGKFTNTDKGLILNSITSAGTLSHEYLVSLMEKESIEKILLENGIIEFSLIKGSLKDFKEKNTLVSVENALDRCYYGNLMQFSKTLSKEGDLFRNFLINEVEILNILTLLRLKRSQIKAGVKELIIPTENKFKDSKIMELANLDSLEQLSAVLNKTEYKEVISKGIGDFKKNNSLIMLETELYKYLLRQSMLLLHQHPLSVSVILGYMLAKDIEVRNLKIIVKGKQLGLSEDFIESQLVY